MTDLSFADVEAAAARITGRVREVVVAPAESSSNGAQLHLALEFLQHTGTFKARGAQNLIRAHREAGTPPEAGVTIASEWQRGPGLRVGGAGRRCAGDGVPTLHRSRGESRQAPHVRG